MINRFNFFLFIRPAFIRIGLSWEFLLITSMSSSPSSLSWSHLTIGDNLLSLLLILLLLFLLLFLRFLFLLLLLNQRSRELTSSRNSFSSTSFSSLCKDKLRQLKGCYTSCSHTSRGRYGLFFKKNNFLWIFFWMNILNFKIMNFCFEWIFWIFKQWIFVLNEHSGFL